jgi:type IV secretion system protein TrbE
MALECTADMLPWSHLAGSGMVFTKSSQIVVGYYFRPPDAASRTDDESDALSDHINAALAVLGSGWATWTDAVSYPSGPYPAREASHFPDPFSRAVDDARRQHFEASGTHYENDRVLCVSYEPPAAHVSKLTDLLYSNGGSRRAPTQARVLEYFNTMLGRFENTVAGTLDLRRMQTFTVADALGHGGRQDELVNYLNYCATGRVQGIMLPKSGAYLDQLIAGQEVWVGENPIIGNDYVAVVTIDGIPAESHPNIIAALSTMERPYRFTQRMIFLDPTQATKEIRKYRDRWKQKKRGLMNLVYPSPEAPVDEHAAGRQQEGQAALAWAESGTVKFGFYSPAIILRHPDPLVLKEWSDDVEQTMARCGFAARTETTNTIEAWRGANPGDTQSNVRRPPIHTKTAADLLPLSGIWTGDYHAPCPLYPRGAPALLWADTAGAIPFRLNIHVGDVPHTLTLGPSGMGKTVLMNTVAVQALRYRAMRITAFDYKCGMMATALACGGRHFDLANENSQHGLFCPLGDLDSETDIEWAADYLAVLYELQTQHAPDSSLRIAISNAIRDRAAAPRHLRTLTNFVSALQDIEARRVFEFYTMRGPAGRFMDGVADPDDDCNFQVYETQDLMTLGEPVALAVLLYQFRRFERTLDGRPALLFLAEAWQVLGHPIWRSRLAKWLRTLRSKNGGVLMDTQSLSEIAGSPLLALLVENCPRKIFLSNPQAMQSTGSFQQPGPYELYRTFGLNDRQIGIIQNAVPKREYYVTGPDGNRKISLGLSPLELAVCGATSEADVGIVRQLYRTHGDRWLSAYLADKGIPYEAGAKPQEVIYA